MNRLILYGWGFKAPTSKNELLNIRIAKRQNKRLKNYKHETDGN